MKRLLALGSYGITIVLILIGIGAMAAGYVGNRQVHDSLVREKITGTADMKPSAHPGKGVSCDVAKRSISTGVRAHCFAEYMRLHALESTDGKVYAEMPQYVDAAGTPTNQKSAAATDPKTGQPAANTARNVWVTETALSTALNTSFLAESVARFAMVVGLALFLAGLLLFAQVHLDLAGPRSRRRKR